jgi:hypothetical protein
MVSSPSPVHPDASAGSCSLCIAAPATSTMLAVTAVITKVRIRPSTPFSAWEFM